MSNRMGTIREIENAVRDLSAADLAAFRAWFAEFDAGVWDAKLEADAGQGRLDELAGEASRDFEEGRCSDL